MIKVSIQEDILTIANKKYTTIFKIQNFYLSFLFILLQIQNHFYTIKIINKNLENIGAPQYVKQILTTINVEINSNAMTMGNFNTHIHQWMHRPDGKLTRKHKL